MKIRRAEIGDEKKIAAVIVITWKNAYQGILPDAFLAALTTEKHERLFKEHLKAQTETIIVLENEAGEIVAMVSGGKDHLAEFDCEIVAIYVLPEYQKRGCGRLLFENIIEEHKKKRYKSMIVWTFAANKDQKFYEKLGGAIRKTGSHNIGGKEIPTVGYVWDDIDNISG